MHRPPCPPAASPRRLARLAAVAVLVAACKPKPEPGDGDDSADSGSGDGADGGGGAVVWDDLRLETSATLTCGFPSGAGFYAAADDGDVYLRQEGAWVSMGLDVDAQLNGVWGQADLSSTSIVAVGDGGVVASFDGTAWAAATDLGTANMEAVSGSSPADLVAVGWGGAYTWDGAAWTFSPIDGNPQFNGVWSDGFTSIAVGEGGAIATRGTDGAWALEEHPSRARLYDVSGDATGEVWAVGEGGTALRRGTAGWEVVETPTAVPLWGVHVVSSTAVYVVGNNGFAARWDGSAWVELPTGVDNNLYNVEASETGTVWAVGNRGMALRLQPGY
jgi:hypothetical protein